MTVDDNPILDYWEEIKLGLPVSKKVKKQVQKLVMAPADGAVARIFGVPVKVESAVADDAVLFGNMGKGYAANVNEEVSMTVEDHVSARNTDYGGYAILDGGVLNTKAFAYVKKSS
ncbi:MAG: phage major capsid protein [Acidaminococcaceae bacterium]|nr:phage major capsid protein [Acidaminococcaceae bacterium]